MMPDGREVAASVYGAWRLLRLDTGGLNFFDASVEGFWKSFYAAAIVAPGYIILVAIHLAEAEPAAGPLRIVLVQSIAYVISWVAFPLLIYYLCEAIGRQNRFLLYIVAFNWAKVIQMGIYLPITALTGTDVLPQQVAGLINFGVTLLILAYEWYITRHALEVSGFGAVGIVALDLMLSVLITVVADGMVF